MSNKKVELTTSQTAKIMELCGCVLLNRPNVSKIAVFDWKAILYKYHAVIVDRDYKIMQSIPYYVVGALDILTSGEYIIAPKKKNTFVEKIKKLDFKNLIGETIPFKKVTFRQAFLNDYTSAAIGKELHILKVVTKKEFSEYINSVVIENDNKYGESSFYSKNDLREYLNFATLDPDLIKDDACRNAYCYIKRIFPRNGDNFIKFICSKVFGIEYRQDKTTLDRIKHIIPGSAITLEVLLSKKVNLYSLAKVYHRHKKFFAVLRESKKLRPYVNKISRYAKNCKRKEAISYRKDIIANCEIDKMKCKELTAWLKTLTDDKMLQVMREKLNLLRLIELYNYTNMSLYSDIAVYNTNDFKHKVNVYVNKNTILHPDVMRINSNCYSIISELVKDKFKNTVFYIPDGIDYAVPINRQSICGVIPYGTSIKINEYNHEIDLVKINTKAYSASVKPHVVDDTTKIPNNNYKGVQFKGDHITDSDDCKRFIIKLDDEQMKSCIIFMDAANQYNASFDKTCKFYIHGNSEIFELTTKLHSSRYTNTIGCVYDKKFIVCKPNFGIWSIKDTRLIPQINKYEQTKLLTKFKLHELIELSGGTIVDDFNDFINSNGAIDLSPNMLTKTTFLDILDALLI